MYTFSHSVHLLVAFTIVNTFQIPERLAGNSLSGVYQRAFNSGHPSWALGIAWRLTVGWHSSLCPLPRGEIPCSCLSLDPEVPGSLSELCLVSLKYDIFQSWSDPISWPAVIEHFRFHFLWNIFLKKNVKDFDTMTSSKLNSVLSS